MRLELPTQNLNPSQLLLNIPEWIHQTHSDGFFLHVANRKLLMMPSKSSDPRVVLHTELSEEPELAQC